MSCSMCTHRSVMTSLLLLSLAACGGDPRHGDDGSDTSSDGDPAADGKDSQRSDAGKARKDGGNASASTKTDAGASSATRTASSCKAESLDLTGCSCDKAGATRACYSGPALTRSVGACRDGEQTCQGGGEFGANYSACSGEVLPEGDSCKPSTPPDAGIPPGCKLVQGHDGNGQLSDGTLFCEDDVGAGIGDFFGGLFGGASAGGADAGP